MYNSTCSMGSGSHLLSPGQMVQNRTQNEEREHVAVEALPLADAPYQENYQAEVYVREN